MLKIVLSGNVGDIKRAIERGDDVNEVGPNKKSVLWAAVTSYNPAVTGYVILILLAAGADPDQPGPDGRSCVSSLFDMYSSDRYSMVVKTEPQFEQILTARLKALLEGGANPELATAGTTYIPDPELQRIRDTLTQNPAVLRLLLDYSSNIFQYFSNMVMSALADYLKPAFTHNPSITFIIDHPLFIQSAQAGAQRVFAEASPEELNAAFLLVIGQRHWFHRTFLNS